jgi:phage-related baseplate assembly protein
MGICNIYVLSTEGNGTASEDLLNVVNTALNAKSVRPLTDRPIIYSASIINYIIEAEIYIDEGPDETIVLNSCYKATEEYIQKSIHLMMAFHCLGFTKHSTKQVSAVSI